MISIFYADPNHREIVLNLTLCRISKNNKICNNFCRAAWNPWPNILWWVENIMVIASELLQALKRRTCTGQSSVIVFKFYQRKNRFGPWWRYFETFLYTWHKQGTQHNFFICQEYCCMESTECLHQHRCQGITGRIQYLRRSWSQAKDSGQWEKSNDPSKQTRWKIQIFSKWHSSKE